MCEGNGNGKEEREREQISKSSHIRIQNAHATYLCLFFIYEDPINVIKSRTILFYIHTRTQTRAHKSPVILINVHFDIVWFLLLKYGCQNEGKRKSKQHKTWPMTIQNMMTRNEK